MSSYGYCVLKRLEKIQAQMIHCTDMKWLIDGYLPCFEPITQGQVHDVKSTLPP
jgi:hypothetical protein